MDESDTESSNSTDSKPIPSTIPSARRPSLLAPLGRQHHYGSFYLRMGAVGKFFNVKKKNNNKVLPLSRPFNGTGIVYDPANYICKCTN